MIILSWKHELKKKDKKISLSKLTKCMAYIKYVKIIL